MERLAQFRAERTSPGRPACLEFQALAPCMARELLGSLGLSKPVVSRAFSRGQLLRAAPEATAPSGPASAGDRPAMSSPLRPQDPLAAGDQVVFQTCVTRAPLAPDDAPLRVLYEDPFVLAVDKPAGLLVHGDGSGAPTLAARAGGYLARAGNPAVPQAVQRLDVETTGVVLFSKTEEFQGLFDALVAEKSDAADKADAAQKVDAAEKLGVAQKPDRAGSPDRLGKPPADPRPAMEKRYLAVVSGAFPQARAVLDAPIARDRHDARRMRTARPGQGQRALTQVERLAVSPDGAHSLLLVRLGTGRKHQIRVHLADRGFPVANDPLYGSVESGAGLMLHAWEERFVHPVTGAPVRVCAGWPARFSAWFSPQALETPSIPVAHQEGRASHGPAR